MMKPFIVLVDDDYDDGELFQDAVSELDNGVQFLHLTDGKQLFSYLDKSTNKRPDLILLDINMPEMNGWQCLKKIREDYHKTHIPVFIYSTSSQNREKEMGEKLGADGFFTKPSDFRSLKNLLEQIVDSIS